MARFYFLFANLSVRALIRGKDKRTNAKFIRNFNIGVLVLLVPPVSIFCTIFIVLRKYRGTD